MIRTMATVGVGLLLVAGCTSDSDPGAGPGSSAAAPSSASASAPATWTSNGTLISTLGGGTDDELTILAQEILEDGTLGSADTVLVGVADDGSYPAVIDGFGPWLLTGSVQDYWTTDLQVRQDGAVVDEITAERWCGGEGLGYNVCVLLDSDRVARTTALGRDPVSGSGPTEGSIIVSSLADGSTVAEYGPFADLTDALGTSSPDQLLLVTTPFDPDGEAPSTVLRLDLDTGTTAEIGTSPVGWVPTCAIGLDAALGGTVQEGYEAAVVGTADAAGDIVVQDGEVVGCSADGRFLYVQSYEVEQANEDDAVGDDAPDTTLQLIDVASGERDSLLVLDPGVLLSMTTR